MTDLRLDKYRARRAFHQAAAGYDEVAVLQQEMGRRLLQRLQLVRLQPKYILDMGSGTAAVAPQLMKQYPKAQLVALDFAEGMLRQAVTAALDTARDQGDRSIALPAISSGIFGYPRAQAAMVIAGSVATWVSANPGVFDEVRLVGFDETTAADFAAGLDGS